MKRASVLLITVAALSQGVLGQSDLTQPSAAESFDSVQQVGPPGNGVWAITEAGAHHRRWAKVNQILMEDGSFQATTNTFVELAGGLNRLDPNGRWIPSEATFELVNGHAVARHTAHSVILTSPTDTLPVDMLTPDGQRLSSRIIGLAYYSATTGKSVLIAEPKQSLGQLDGNQVIYADCFDGGLRASLQYSITLAGLEQDVIIATQLPPVSDYGFGDNEDVRLQLLTEFLAAPRPTITQLTLRSETDPLKRQGKVEPDLTDQILDFGLMRIGTGRAFDLGAPPEVLGPAVFKHWEVINGRNVLFEELSLQEAAPLLNNLPAYPQAGVKRAGKSQLMGSRKELLANLKQRHPVSKAIAMASNGARRAKGLAIDYSILQSVANFTFKGDVTYFVTNAVSLTGATIIEGGTVVKAVPWTGGQTKITFGGSLACNTSSYRPATFTARDDDTVGEVLPASTHTPSGYYCDWLDFGGASPIALSNLRLRYSFFGMTLWSSTNYAVSHVQFLGCDTALEVAYGAATVRNALFQNSFLAMGLDCGSSIAAEHITADVVTNFNSINGDSSNHFCLTNCLVTLPSYTNAYVGVNNAFPASNSGVFAPVGGGGAYLAINSPYRGAGTTQINPVLLAALKQKTTWPPIVLTSDFTVPTVLAPQAQRDSGVSALALGYHYDPLDYCVSSLNLTNTTLLLTNGVAIAVYGTKGLTLRSGAHLISEGTPLSLNRLVGYQTVQEQPIFWGDTNSSTISLLNVSSASPEIRLRFTDMSMLANTTAKRYFILSSGSVLNPLSVTDSQLRGVYLDIYSTSASGMSINLNNNLVERSHLSFYQEALPGYYPFTLNIYNQLFYGGTNTFNYKDGSTTWTIKDSLFDTNTLSGGTQNFVNSNNGYHNTTPLPGALTNKIITTATYLSGPLGLYYYPTNAGTNTLSDLINGGSRYATSAGLYHYTTTTNQVKEAGSIVDCGFHYVALDATGNPLDVDADGIPDYLEDRNGNGVVDSGETNWQDAYDFGFRVFITEPKSNSNVP